MDKVETTYLKLSDLTRKVRDVIHSAFGDEVYWIVAEVSGHKFYPDRDRHYFDLVEKMDNATTETAKVKANAWAHGSAQIASFQQVTGQRFQDGLQVLICVRVNYHIVHGFSLTLFDIDPNFTLGNLERLRRETLEKLVRENSEFIHFIDGNYVTRNKQLKFGSVIQRIALIGSPKSEGYTDFIHTINNNQFGYQFSVDNYFSSVQGAGAEQELVKTLIQIFENNKIRSYDCVVITRGGGARTDFLVFDTYILSKATAKFPIPIITGIGHHKDVSIVDLMAHTQTKTPTKAAEFILAHNRSFEESLTKIQQRLIIKTQQILSERVNKINKTRSAIAHVVPRYLSRNREELQSLGQMIRHIPGVIFNTNKNALNKSQHNIIDSAYDILYHNDRKLDSLFYKFVNVPRGIVSSRKEKLQSMVKLLGIYNEQFLANQKKFLQHQQALFKMMSPANILKKGFAIVKQDGKIVTTPDRIKEGSSLTVTLQETDIHTTVNSKEESDGKFDI